MLSSWQCVFGWLAQVKLAMWKADIDAAFRRVPIAIDQRLFAYVAWGIDDKRVAFAQHRSMPFGSIASVHRWDRIGMHRF